MRTDAFAPGDSVVYTPPTGGKPEYGTVTSTNSRWVFVRYGEKGGGIATHPDNLTVLVKRR